MNTIVKLFTLQAFVITKHLQTMGGEGRVMVVRFGYSSIKTIPQVGDKEVSYFSDIHMNTFAGGS